MLICYNISNAIVVRGVLTPLFYEKLLYCLPFLFQILSHTLPHPFPSCLQPHIFTPAVIFSQQLSLWHWMKNSMKLNIYFPRCLFFWNIIHLQKPYLLIRCYKTKLFQQNTNNTSTNGVNKQKAHTNQTLRERKHW